MEELADKLTRLIPSDTPCPDSERSVPDMLTLPDNDLGIQGSGSNTGKQISDIRIQRPVRRRLYGSGSYGSEHDEQTPTNQTPTDQTANGN